MWSMALLLWHTYRVLVSTTKGFAPVALTYSTAALTIGGFRCPMFPFSPKVVFTPMRSPFLMGTDSPVVDPPRVDSSILLVFWARESRPSPVFDLIKNTVLFIYIVISCLR